jgi:hypothetical protein
MSKCIPVTLSDGAIVMANADLIRASNIIAREPRRIGELSDPKSGYGFDSGIYYQGKPLERDTTTQSAIIHTRPTRDHWWQF